MGWVLQVQLRCPLRGSDTGSGIPCVRSDTRAAHLQRLAKASCRGQNQPQQPWRPGKGVRCATANMTVRFMYYEYIIEVYASVSVFRSARALSRYGPWTATSTYAPIEWSVIVSGAGVGRTKKPEVVRHPPTMCRGGTTISPGRAYRHRAVATCCSGTSFFLRHVCILVV